MHVCGGEVEVQKSCVVVRLRFKKICVWWRNSLAFLIGRQVIAYFVQTQDRKMYASFCKRNKQMIKYRPMKVHAYEKRKFGRSGVTNREVQASVLRKVRRKELNPLRCLTSTIHTQRPLCSSRKFEFP